MAAAVKVFTTKYFKMYKDKTDPIYYYCDAVRKGIQAAEALIDEATHAFCNSLIRALKMGPTGPASFDTELKTLTYRDVLNFARYGDAPDNVAAKIEIVIKKSRQFENCYAYVLRDSEARVICLNETAINSFIVRFSAGLAENLKQTIEGNLIEPESAEPEAKKRRGTQKGRLIVVEM